MAGASSTQVSSESSKLAFRAGFFYLFGRVILVRGPLHGDARNSHSISVQDQIVTTKTNAQASTLISYPPDLLAYNL